MVSCTTVRDLLTEHALGVAGVRETVIVERHLSWCAACRKESADLARAAATLAYALPAVSPTPELGSRVVQAVHEVSGRPPHAGTGRSRRVGTLVLAAAIALSGLGVGAVVARRATPGDQLAASGARSKDAFSEFTELIAQSTLVDPRTDVFLGVLEPPGEGRAAGTAMTIVVPRVDDRVVVMVTGLNARPPRLPYGVSITDGRGEVVRVGDVTTLDPGGQATVGLVTPFDLTSFLEVTVTDAKGRTVLVGTLRERTTVASPAP